MKNPLALLDKLLERRRITSSDELTDDERSDFDRWREILTKEAVETGDIEALCKHQRSIIEGLFETDVTPERARQLTLLHSVYSKILALIESPKEQRENLIHYLEKLLDHTPDKGV